MYSELVINVVDSGGTAEALVHLFLVKKKYCLIKFALCVLCDCSSCHVPGDQSIITAPPPAAGNTHPDRLRDMACFI